MAERLCVGDDGIPVGPVSPVLHRLLDTIAELDDYADYTRIGIALTDLLDKCETVILHRDITDDTYTVTSTATSGVGVATVTQQELADALAVYVKGEVQKKRCAQKGCRKLKPLNQFSYKKDSKDGRNRYCRECEVARQRRWRERTGRAKGKTRTEGDRPGAC